MGRHDDALRAIDRSLSFEWDRGQTGDRGIETHKRHIVRAQILAILGRHEEALELFDFALGVDPAYGPCLFSKAATLEKLERFEEAAACFHRAGEDETIRHNTLKGEGRCFMAIDDLSRARDCFRDAWQLEPQDIETWIRWCSACADLGDGAGLLEAYEAHSKFADPSVGMLINWARALASNGEADRALQLFTEAIRREPENANAYFNCGDLLFSLGNMYDAAHLYESGLKLAPENADAWFTLGNSLAKLGIVEGAAISYRRTLEIRPDHLPAQHNLEQIAA
jgi:tetratricopeptide (TPR) repeat protein